MNLGSCDFGSSGGKPKQLNGNTMHKPKMQVLRRAAQSSPQAHECICHTSSVTIELDRETASEFTKDWGQQESNKQFKLSFDATLNPKPVLKVSKITAVRPPVNEVEEIYEISLDDVGKVVKLVKVEDGTFEYCVESNESDEIAESNETTATEGEVEDDTSISEVSGIFKMDESEIQENVEIAESYTTSAQNRPPVIIRNDVIAQNQSTPNQVDEAKVTKPEQSKMEVEILGQVTTSPSKLQKQLAEVAPFHLNKRPSPKRHLMTTQLLSEEFKSCLIQLGPNNTTVSGNIYHSINWASVREATRKLLSATFPREVLASHSLTGKPSPAFRNLPIKKRLDPAIVEDIIHIVSKKCNVDARTVRSVITLKCADENKMLRLRKAKEKRNAGQKAKGDNNKENRA